MPVTTGIERLKDSQGNVVPLYNGLGRNGTLELVLKDKAGAIINITGFTIKMRMVRSDFTTEIIPEQSATITNATDGEFEFDLSALNIAETNRASNIMIIYNDAPGEDVVLVQLLVDLVEGATS